MKHCPKCNSTKEDLEFYNEAKRPDGLSGWCKCCYREYNKAQYRKKPNRTTDIVKPRSIVIKERIRHEQVVKYGSAVAEIIEAMDGIDGF